MDLFLNIYAASFFGQIQSIDHAKMILEKSSSREYSTEMMLEVLWIVARDKLECKRPRIAYGNIMQVGTMRYMPDNMRYVPIECLP